VDARSRAAGRWKVLRTHAVEQQAGGRFCGRITFRTDARSIEQQIQHRACDSGGFVVLWRGFTAPATLAMASCRSLAGLYRACDSCDGVSSFSGGTFLTFLAAFAQNFILTALYVDCCCSGLWTAALLTAVVVNCERRQNSSARCLLFRGHDTPREHTPQQQQRLCFRAIGRRHRHAHPRNKDISNRICSCLFVVLSIYAMEMQLSQASRKTAMPCSA
jgi:hypothetical protein